MQKFIRILAIVAAVLVGLSFLLLLISIPLQQTIAAEILKYPDDMLAYLPIFPLASFVDCFLLLGCGILLIVCCGNKKGGIWLEILVLAAVVLVLPPLNAVLSNVQNVMIANIRGSTYVAANSVANLISSYCMWPGELGRSVALVTVGMSLVFKSMSKKLDKLAAQ